MIDAPNLNPPHLHGGPLGTARLKSEPADFVVEEILGFEPSGEGEHCAFSGSKKSATTATTSPVCWRSAPACASGW